MRESALHEKTSPTDSADEAFVAMGSVFETPCGSKHSLGTGRLVLGLHINLLACDVEPFRTDDGVFGYSGGRIRSTTHIKKCEMWDQHREDHHMIREISKIVVGAGLLSMLLGYDGRGDDKGLPGPIDSVEDLQYTGKMLFKLADTNNDNLISQKEAIDVGNLLVGGFFFRADTNGDGKLSPDELRAAREALFNQKPLLRFIFQRTSAEVNRQGSQAAVNPEKQKLINLLDTNHDSTLSAVELRQEVQSGVQSLFLMADVNNDGQLDPAEVNGAVVELGRTALQTAFNAADVDKNGALSQAEFDKAILNLVHVLFRNLDANNDNQISADEMRSGMQILIRELKATRVPEPPNSISNQLRPQGTAATSPTQPTTSIPAHHVQPAPTVPVQPAPTVAPTRVVPPQR